MAQTAQADVLSYTNANILDLASRAASLSDLAELAYADPAIAPIHVAQQAARLVSDILVEASNSNDYPARQSEIVAAAGGIAHGLHVSAKGWAEKAPVLVYVLADALDGASRDLQSLLPGKVKSLEEYGIAPKTYTPPEATIADSKGIMQCAKCGLQTYHDKDWRDDNEACSECGSSDLVWDAFAEEA